jgi:photosystem II stability/assembly factor-like uncharacterized protein
VPTEQEVVEQLTRFYRETDEAIPRQVDAWQPDLRRRQTSWRRQVLATAAVLALIAGVGLLVREARLFRQNAPATSPRHGPGAGMTFTQGSPVQPVGLLSPSDGWTAANEALHITHDGGKSWADITPPGAAGTCCAVFFLDRNNGWAGGAWSPDSRTLLIYRTRNAGASWSRIGVAGPSLTSGPCCPTLDFTDEQHGWLVYRDSTPDGAEVGVLLQTIDGGATWTQLPLLPAVPVRRAFIGDLAVHFVDTSRGWFVGTDSAGAERLYLTRDGGSHWSVQALPGVANDNPLYPGMPAALGRLMIEPITLQSGRVFADASTDGGVSWHVDPKFSVVLPPPGTVGAPSGYQAPTFVGHGVVALFVGPTLELNDGTGWKTIHPSGLVGQVDYVEFANARVGWALTYHNCGDTCGVTQFLLMKTTDGGQTWTDVRS